MRILHQNLRTYGASARRCDAYIPTFVEIGQQPVAQPPQPTQKKQKARFGVAGFTEVMNNSDQVCAELDAFASMIAEGLKSLAVMQVGQTALGANPECIGIAWDPKVVTVDHVGQVLWDPAAKKWQVYGQAPTPGQVTKVTVPAEAGADSRGPAYVACEDAGQQLGPSAPYLIAFMHNMYGLGDRSSGFRALAGMAAQLRSDIGGAYATAEIAFGGDFNVNPDDVKSRKDDLTLFYKAAEANGTLEKTTKVHTYDFWLVSDGTIDKGAAKVWTQTRDVEDGLSDHAAITLDIF